MIIFENVSTQAALERAAQSIASHLGKKLSKASDGVSLFTGDLGIETKNDAVNTLINDYNVKIDLKLDPDGKLGYEGLFNGRIHANDGSIGVVEIALIAHRMNAATVFKAKYPNIVLTLIHELQHALDYSRSGSVPDLVVPGGKASGMNRGYMDKKALDAARTGAAVSLEDDFNYSHEINARYAQAIAIAKRDPSNKSFIQKFISHFPKWNNIPRDQQKRLLSRAGAEESNLPKKRVVKPSELRRLFQGFSVDYAIKDGLAFTKFVVNGHEERVLDKLEELSKQTKQPLSLPLGDVMNNPTLKAIVSQRIKQKKWVNNKGTLVLVK